MKTGHYYQGYSTKQRINRRKPIYKTTHFHPKSDETEDENGVSLPFRYRYQESISFLVVYANFKCPFTFSFSILSFLDFTKSSHISAPVTGCIFGTIRLFEEDNS